MNANEPSDSVQIEFHFSEKYREQVVAENKPDSWIEIAIAVDDMYIYGDNEGGVTGFACGAVLQFLDSVDLVLAGERYIAEFEYGPTWLALDPRDENSIYVSKCMTWTGANNPEKRLDIDISRPATKQTWITEVLETATEFHERVIELNPELEDREVLKQIREEIAAAEQSYRGSNLN